MNIRMDRKNRVKRVKIVQLKCLSELPTKPELAQSSMDREIWPTKLDKILGKSSMMHLETIPKRKSSTSFYIERPGDADFEWNTLKISHANQRRSNEDWMFRRVENPKKSKATKSHNWNLISSWEIERREVEASVVFERVS
jgi:hypothetical protein